MTGPRRSMIDSAPGRSELLNRNSFVPLYYQLQELLKGKIESNVWRPGDSLPSEPELAAQFGVSRVVVRQALAILEDDRQIVRVRGRGTLVITPKLSYQVGGLSRMLLSARDDDVVIQVLDSQLIDAEPGMLRRLAALPGESLLRITTVLTLRKKPLVISYSYFRKSRTKWLTDIFRVGEVIPPELTLAPFDVTLGHSELTVETSQCGQFEADRFGIDHRSPVFLALCREFERTDAGEVPFEVARVECRGDILRIRFDRSYNPPDDGPLTVVPLPG